MATQIKDIEIDDRWARRALNSLEQTIPSRLKKEFVHFMFEAGFWDLERLTQEAAISRVNECLRTDPEKRQFFKVTELWAWMKHSGEHALFQEMGADLRYRVERIPTETLVAELLSRIDARMDEAGAAFADVKSMRSELVAITTAQRGQTISGSERPVRFSRKAFGTF